jgi:hypothetical protein
VDDNSLVLVGEFIPKIKQPADQVGIIVPIIAGQRSGAFIILFFSLQKG